MASPKLWHVLPAINIRRTWNAERESNEAIDAQRILPCVHGVGHVKFIADVCVLPLANEDAVDIHAAEGIQHCAKEHGSSQNRTGRGFSR